MIEPITGTTDACLRHFSSAAGLNHVGRDTPRAVYKPRNKICKLLKIGLSAGYDWFGKHVMPSGVNLLKLQYFLEQIGYTIVERENLSQAQRDLAILLALDVVSLDHVGQYTGVTRNTILRWSTGRIQPPDQKADLIKTFISLQETKMKEKQDSWRMTLQELNYIPVRVHTEGEKFAPTGGEHRDGHDGSLHGQQIYALAHLILAARSLAEQILSDTYSPDERENLRRQTQVGRSNALFELSNLLSRLCSERARREMSR